MVDETAFFDVEPLPDGFSIPELKWRELVFIGALRRDGDCFVRDPSRPLPRFERADLFPPGVRLKVEWIGGRVAIRPVS